jgi:hypothetical protein
MFRESLTLTVIFAMVGVAVAAITSPSYGAAKSNALAGYGNLPLVFEPNQGQADERVRFLSRGPGYQLFLTETGAVLSLAGSRQRSEALKITLRSARVGSRIGGLDHLPGVSNYFIGRDRSKWRTGVPHYAKVAYDNVYPGIDLVFYGTDERQLEFDFVLAAGADPGVIALSIEGAERLWIDEGGDLVMALSSGQVRLLKPIVYQEEEGENRPVEGGYVLKDGRVTFDLSDYDTAKPLVIDPVLAYATYLGGSNIEEYVRSIAVDGNNNVYVTGRTRSPDFPTVDAIQDFCVDSADSPGCHDAFVAKLDSTGSNLLYSTYLGGASLERGWGISVDTDSNAYVAGEINNADVMTSDFPTTPGAFQDSALSANDAFFVKLNATGGLVYSTYLGGMNGPDIAWDIAVDHLGRAVIGGETGSDDFPTTTDAFDRTCGDDFGEAICAPSIGDAFVAVIDPEIEGSAGLAYATFLGGDALDGTFGVAVDGDGLAYLTGATKSSGFPTTAGAVQDTLLGPDSSAFLTIVDPTAQGAASLFYSSYLGGDDGKTIGRDVDIKPGCATRRQAPPCRFPSPTSKPFSPSLTLCQGIWRTPPFLAAIAVGELQFRQTAKPL